jgi:hypothetical protein
LSNPAARRNLQEANWLALHVVERYYGREVVEVTAAYLEYHGDLWKNPEYRAVNPVTAANR